MWEEQWALFAENFYDGKAHISIEEKTLLLLPGAGFGDLSHPTTRLMIQLMKGRIEGNAVVDIGSGSGILTLAALMMGAKSAIGIDIDDKAIQHARKNAKLNQLKAQFGKKVPKQKRAIFLMNMIFSEQKSVEPSQYKPDLWITSGILESQVPLYLEKTSTWGWHLVTTAQESEWCGFIFSTPGR